MKNYKIVAILAVLTIYAALITFVVLFIDASNAGLHILWYCLLTHRMQDCTWSHKQ